MFIYTDGVTEAMNPAGDMFGENRVIAELGQMRGISATEIARTMRAALRRYTAGAEQSDDVTMLVFRLLPKTTGVS